MRRARIAMMVGLALAGLSMAGSALADIPPPVAPVIIPNAATTTKYDPVAGFPDANGPFSAMMVVVPQAEIDQFTKDDGQSRNISRVSRAEPGALLAIKLMFIGLMPDWNGNANVSYDLQVYAPNGQIYAGSDYRNLEALRSKVSGDGTGVFDNRGKIVMMQFEDADVPGVYVMKATVHDNVAKRDIALQTSVELLPKATGPVVPDAAAITLPDELTTALTGEPEAKTPAPAKKKSKKSRRRRSH